MFDYDYKTSRAIAKIDQSEMIKRLKPIKLSKTTLSAYENYRRYPPVNVYWKMCDITGCSIKYEQDKKR